MCVCVVCVKRERGGRAINREHNNVTAHSQVGFAPNVGLCEGVDGLSCDAKVTQLHLTSLVDQNV